MIQTQRLDYTDNREHITALTKILSTIPKPFAPEMKETVDFILGRLDQLQSAQSARLSLYDQFQERR